MANTLSTPVTKGKPRAKILFDVGELAGTDFGEHFKKIEFRAMVNGGYIVRIKLFDPSFTILNTLVEEGYFKEARIKPVPVYFQLYSESPDYPETATRLQVAILISMKANGAAADKADLEFIAIDPPSWFLNIGDGSGKVYKGRVDQVIKQVVSQYAPEISLEIGKTTDSAENKWAMMRQDPKSFIASMMDWSSSVTMKKTQWIIMADGYNLEIKEQGAIPSTQRAYYRYLEAKDHDSIKSWDFLSDNALSAVQTKIITQGISAVSGQYLDRITDEKEEKLFAKDSRTANKQIARTKSDQSFTKPTDEARPTTAGWTSVMAVPEIYSSGDIGLRYDEYIDGRPRALWLNMVNALQRVKLRVIGHGIWSDCEGLGVDTIFVKWTKAESSGDSQRYWWMSGNWLVYGFEHIMDKGSWYTDLYCARSDWNSNAVKVGG